LEPQVGGQARCTGCGCGCRVGATCTSPRLGATMLHIQFQVECSATKPGDIVFVVGGSKALGAWDPLNALPCTTSKKEFPFWTSAEFPVEPGTANLEFKLLLQPSRPTSNSDATWEPGDNHSVQLPRTGGLNSLVTLKFGWGQTEVEKVETKVGSGYDAAPPKKAVQDGASGGRHDNQIDRRAGLRPGAAFAEPQGAVCSGAGMPRVDTGMHPLMALACDSTTSLDLDDSARNTPAAGAGAVCSGATGAGMPRVDTGMHPLLAMAGERQTSNDSAPPAMDHFDGAYCSGGGMQRVDTGMHPLMGMALSEPAESPQSKVSSQIVPDFLPITVDGKEVTAAKLRNMNAAELKELCRRLTPVLDAATQALAGASSGH